MKGQRKTNAVYLKLRKKHELTETEDEWVVVRGEDWKWVKMVKGTNVYLEEEVVLGL